MKNLYRKEWVKISTHSHLCLTSPCISLKQDNNKTKALVKSLPLRYRYFTNSSHLPRAVRLIAYSLRWRYGQYASDPLNPTRAFLSFSLQLREYGKLQSANSAALSQFILHDLLCSSMSAEPPSKSTHLLPQLNKRPERQWPLPLTRQSPQTFLYGQSGIRRCRLQC